MARAGYRENRADASLVSSRGAPGDARRRYIARRGRLGRDRSRDEGQKILVRGQQLLARRERPPRLASPREGAVLGTGVRASSKSEAASSQGRVPGGPSSSVRPSGSEAGASPGGGAGTSSVVVDYAAAKVGGGRCGKGASEEEEEEEEAKKKDGVWIGSVRRRRARRVVVVGPEADGDLEGSGGVGLLALEGSLPVPEGGGEDLGGDAAVLVLAGDELDLVEEGVVEERGLEAEVAELSVGDVELVLGGLLARVGEEAGRDAGALGDDVGDVADAPGLGDLVEDLDGRARLGRVVDGELDALARVRDVDEGARLAARAVDGEGDAEGGLHEEAVEDGAVVAVVVEAVEEAVVHGGERRVGAPDDALVEVGHAEGVVLVVELEEEGVEALGGVVDRAGVGRVEDLGRPAAGKRHVDVALRDLAARGAVPVDAHRPEVDQVGARVRLDDRRQHVVRPAHVVVNRVPLLALALLRVRRRSLLGEVHDRVRPARVDQRREPVVVLRDVDVREVDRLPRQLVPRREPRLGMRDRRQRVAPELHVDLTPRHVVHDRHVVTRVRQVQRRRPPAEPVPAQHQDLLPGRPGLAARVRRRPARDHRRPHATTHAAPRKDALSSRGEETQARRHQHQRAHHASRHEPHRLQNR
eukprot:CAMPEP_0197391946 /NCGR_PEP_ID=MMETSP1165-20131217/3423_1 /TAXON_ID=284809 /ORGANISM="Chrysocystis fragilis, Strain CCMP3189" /LENGTH=642 /DNA_ID=CAMNT_0042917545 /DNA_START=154 /DNA_END=2080 /DNA_ORIENTATION=+